MHLPSNQPFFSVPLFFLENSCPRSLILAKKIGRNVEISTQFFLSFKNLVLSLFDFSRIRILPENSNFPQPPRVDESSSLSDGYYFLRECWLRQRVILWIRHNPIINAARPRLSYSNYPCKWRPAPAARRATATFQETGR